MLLHEKMRLQRKVMKLTAKQALASSRKERVTKQIERVQKMYSKKEANLDNMAKMYTSSFRNSILCQTGLGAQNQMFNPAAGYGMTSFMMGQAMQLFKGSVPINGQDGNKFPGGSEAEFQACMTAYQSGGLPRKEDGSPDYEKAGITEDAWKAFNMCMQQAQMNQQQVQAYCNNMSSQYETNISIWLDAQKAQLEAEQDAALEPLNEQELEWDLESQSAETQLADARARLDSIKQALSEGIKDSAPTFGLGQ